MLASHNSRRVVPRTVPAFGGGSLVERVRGARRSTSLPALVQAAVVLSAAVLLTACTGLAAQESTYHVGADDEVLLSIKSHGLAHDNPEEPRQVLLETAVITTDAENSDWILQSVNQESGDVVMQLLAEDSRARILSCPSLITLEGQEATLFVGESRRVLEPAADAPSEVKPVEVEVVGLHDELAMYEGIKFEVVTHGAVDGVRPVRIRFVRMEAGKREHELEQDVELRDGRRILLRVHKAAE